MSFLDDLANAHRIHEGWFPGSVSWRNSNPGNLRLTPYQMRAYGAVPGEQGFARFPSYDAGFRALKDDLLAKLTGHSAFIDYTKNPTFLAYVRVYAPEDDGNDPDGYCQSLIRALPQYDLHPDTPLTVLAALAVAYPPPQQDSLAQQLRFALEAVGRVTGARLFALLRKIARLRQLLGKS